MAKDDSNGGFLSKVAKFVRHPTTSWADLDTRTADRESEYSKAALKEMIERKRRNDFVRKREFDALRKVRSREGTSEAGQGLRPSFFQSSLPSRPDDRAMTIKKIDEIEAQMSSGGRPRGPTPWSPAPASTALVARPWPARASALKRARRAMGAPSSAPASTAKPRDRRW